VIDRVPDEADGEMDAIVNDDNVKGDGLEDSDQYSTVIEVANYPFKVPVDGTADHENVQLTHY
jgi:hypothetical protein